MEARKLKIAVLSGKGGTGKTLVSVNLAATAVLSGLSCAYVDCDVEEPNGHLFFKPESLTSEEILVLIPEVDAMRCDGCRACVSFCRFHALAHVAGRVKVFPDICHSCGGCMRVCPQGAISERERRIGIVQSGVSEGVSVLSGIMDTGEESGVPIIRRLLNKDHLPQAVVTFIDCPPGSSCVVMESIREADLCVLVAEPTLFGAHNLAMVNDLTESFGIPRGVILNKCLAGENPSESYCASRDIPIWGRIPYDPGLGALSCDGQIAVREDERWRAEFQKMLSTLLKEVPDEKTADSER